MRLFRYDFQHKDNGPNYTVVFAADPSAPDLLERALQDLHRYTREPEQYTLFDCESTRMEWAHVIYTGAARKGLKA